MDASGGACFYYSQSPTKMTRAEYRVAIVVDPAFSELAALAGRMPVWVCTSTVNREAAEAIWATHTERPVESGVTTFKYDANDSPEQILLGIVATVDLHHGEYSHDPPWTVLEVFGASPTDEVAAALREYGVQRVERTTQGFTASRI